MKICMCNKDFEFTVGGYILKQFKRGKSYIMSEMLVRDISNSAGQDLFGSIRELGNSYRKYNGEDLTDKKIVIWRTGGLGDLCFITPYLKKIKERYPTCKIIFGCGIQYADVMQDHEYIDEFHSVPMDIDILASCHYHLMFEGIIESNPDAEKENAYDLFGKAFGINLEDHEKIPNLSIDEESLEYFKNVEKGMKVTVSDPIKIGIHLKTSSVIRNVPVSVWNSIITVILNSHKDTVVYLLGSQDDIDVGNKISLPTIADGRVVPYFHTVRGFKDSVAAISEMDLVIGGDSSALHIAAAFKKPMIGLFGAFLGDLRLRYYQNAVAINAEIKCSPCFQHGNISCENSDIMGESYCMKIFDVSQIIDEALMLLSITHKIDIKSLTPKAAALSLSIYREHFKSVNKIKQEGVDS